jgi:hypothetical protein
MVLKRPGFQRQEAPGSSEWPGAFSVVAHHRPIMMCKRGSYLGRDRNHFVVQQSCVVHVTAAQRSATGEGHSEGVCRRNRSPRCVGGGCLVDADTK